MRLAFRRRPRRPIDPADQIDPADMLEDLSFYRDDARDLSEQTPVTVTNHAEMLSVAEQHGIADATRPVHDADSLSTGHRPLEFIRRLEAWGRVKVAEARMRAHETLADQRSIIGAITAALRNQTEAEQEVDRARARAESAKEECAAILGSAATAWVEAAGFMPVILLLIILIAFGGEVAFNNYALGMLDMGFAETLAIAFAVGVALCACATQVARLFQNKRYLLGGAAALLFTAVLICTALMLTFLRQEAVVTAGDDVSGATAVDAPEGFDQFTLLGFFAIQFILPITIGLIEYLDHPVARVFGKALREVRKAEKRAKALAKKLPALRERLDVAEARLIMIEARAEEEVELIDRIVDDAKETYLTAFLQAAGDPEVTSAMEQRLEAIEGDRPTASPMRPRLRTVGGESEA